MKNLFRKQTFTVFMLLLSSVVLKAQLSTISTSSTCTVGLDHYLDGTTGTNKNRLGHLQSGTYGDPWSQWAAIGTCDLNYPPSNCNYYGFFSNWTSDRAFFGLRYEGWNQANALIAFGDNHDNGPVPNRLIFQFDSWIPSNNIEIGTMLHNGNFGLHTVVPTATLDIDAAFKPLDPGTNSNVRFRNLQVTPVGNVLIQDGSGYVYNSGIPISSIGSSNYSADQGITIDHNVIQLGDRCGKGGSPFYEDREINILANNLYFNTSEKGGHIFMGISNCQPLITRLEIGTKGLPASNDYNTNSPSTSGLRFTNLTSGDPQISNETGGVLSLDKEGDVIWVKDQVGGGGGISNSCTNINTIPKVISTAGDLGCGIMTDNGVSVGISQPVPRTYSGVGVLISGSPTPGSVAKLDVNGLTFTNSLVVSSDRRFKKNIETIEDPLSIISKLNGVKYDWRKEEFKERNFDNLKQSGFIAQDVEKIYPEAVAIDQDGYYALNYNTFIPLLNNGIKELHKLYQEEKTKNTVLENKITELNNKVDGLIKLYEQEKQTKNSIENKSNFYVYPNPTKGTIVTKQYIPEDSKTAYIQLSDMNGRVVKRVDITCKGECTNVLNFEESSMEGNYIVQFVIDGKTISSEKIMYKK